MTLDVGKVIAEVRSELARRMGRASAAEPRAPADFARTWTGSLPRLENKAEYALEELLAYSDRAFVEAAYAAILRRTPDPQGLETHLGKLRRGEASKVEILAHLRWSPEGEARGVHVDGLLGPYKLHCWRRKRIIGPLIGWAHGLLRLGSLPSRMAWAEAVQARETSGLAARVDELAARVFRRLDDIEEETRRVAAEQAQANDAVRSVLAELKAEAGATSAAVAAGLRRGEQLTADLSASVLALTGREQELRTSLVELAADAAARRESVERQAQAVAALRELLEQREQELLRQGQQLGRLDELGHATAEQLRQMVALGEANERDASRQQRSLDTLYVEFEEQFRGSPELIRERALPYLDFLREAEAGGLYTPVLDLGCGRGDWLDVLREHGFNAHGVDSNEAFVGICRDRGLDVTTADVISYLRSLPDASQGAVTGMHIAEHLPFEVLIELLDQCHRVLCVGGLLALETPNPENLTVATLTFYMDPTHRNPLPPEALRWMVQSRGFERVHIERWTVARDMGAPPLLAADLPGAPSVNVLLSQMHAAPDYAIIARRL
ncbi:methyltransferase domain-containing protein [Arenimonas metalli]|uniref:DUF4214 domain-containing protein n=1 Tax=Arenimonas metalli CF5-1 TaxID=1384056 RepID=A0A091AS16_9GAMM|nr:methyltransferase domain-containing protein [Arenimonas metalli]KFN41927.1 hypothetical protein N787_03950 [Arenimonas metalli CF5-1]